MISHKHIELAVAGVIAKAVEIARKHGQYAFGHEAKVCAAFIANDIEALGDEMHAWEEEEAKRVVASARQAEGGTVNNRARSSMDRKQSPS